MTVHLFLPIRRQGEVDTFPILEEIFRRGKTAVVSVSDFSTGELAHYRLRREDPVAENRFGIPEPLHPETLERVLPGGDRPDLGAAAGLRCTGDSGGIRTRIFTTASCVVAAPMRSRRGCLSFRPAPAPSTMRPRTMSRSMFVYPAGENNVPQSGNLNRGKHAAQ